VKTAEKLRRRRVELGLTQAVVAGKAGMSTVQYNGYEKERHEPSAVTMERLAKALKARPEELWDDEYSDEKSVIELKDALRKKVAEQLGVSARGVRVLIELERG